MKLTLNAIYQIKRYRIKLEGSKSLDTKQKHINAACLLCPLRLGFGAFLSHAESFSIEWEVLESKATTTTTNENWREREKKMKKPLGNKSDATFL